jgi:hypothetical protein
MTCLTCSWWKGNEPRQLAECSIVESYPTHEHALGEGKMSAVIGVGKLVTADVFSCINWQSKVEVGPWDYHA